MRVRGYDDLTGERGFREAEIVYMLAGIVR